MTERRGPAWRLVAALFLVACSPPTPEEIQILTAVQEVCADDKDDACSTSLRTLSSDTYVRHCDTVLWKDWDETLQVDQMVVQPQSGDCPPGSTEMSTRHLPDTCSAFVDDNGDGRWDKGDGQIEQFCVFQASASE